MPSSQPVFAIAISGYGTAADRARSIAAGYRYHIVKPLDIELLDKLLEEVARESSP